jgi:hypothetical protein
MGISCSCELEQPTLRSKNAGTLAQARPTKRFSQAMEWPSTPRTISSITSARRSRTAQPSVGNASFGLRSGGDSVTGTPQTPKAPPSNPLFLSSPNGQHIPGQCDLLSPCFLPQSNAPQFKSEDVADDDDDVLLLFFSGETVPLCFVEKQPLPGEMNPFEFVGEQDDCSTVAFCPLQMPQALLASMGGQLSTEGPEPNDADGNTTSGSTRQ